MRIIAWVLGLAFGIANAQTWIELPGTAVSPANCPPAAAGYDFPFHCRKAVDAWNSGAYDPSTNTMYLAGGGHTDYAGNEVYRLDVATGVMSRMTPPALPLTPCSGGEEMPPCNGTQPTSRHTYGALVWHAALGKVWMGMGFTYPAGANQRGVWLFDPASATWERQVYSGVVPDNWTSAAAAYDPSTELVFIQTQKRIYTWDHATNEMALVTSSIQSLPGNASMVVDANGRWLYVLGNGTATRYPIVGRRVGVPQNIATSPATLAGGPGVIWDGTRLVAWIGDGKLYYFDGTLWSSESVGGPTNLVPGPYGRFGWDGDDLRYVLVRSGRTNAWLYDVSGAPPPPPPPPPEPSPALVAWWSIVYPGQSATLAAAQTLREALCPAHPVTTVPELVCP